MNSGLPVIYFVIYIPISVSMVGAMPESLPPPSITASTAAANKPVWTTLSPFGYLQIMVSYLPLWMALSSLLVSSAALISSCKSLMATLGEWIIMRYSPLNGSSTPLL